LKSNIANWSQLRHLFIEDDGSLPDVFVDNITASDIKKIVEWVESRCDCEPFLVWDLQSQTNQHLTSPSQAVELFQSGKIESFRFPASDIAIGDHSLPTLGFGIYSDKCLEFDYRMGTEWTDSKIQAFFKFMTAIITLSPSAQIGRCEEGCYPNFSPEFAAALASFSDI